MPDYPIMGGKLLKTIPAEVERDRWGRPYVVPPGATKPTSYQRCTTFIDVIESTFNLSQWQQRKVAEGLAQRPDLVLAAAVAGEDKAKLNKIVADAKEAAKAHTAATTGTALHELTEMYDRGQGLPAGLSAATQADVDAYIAATAGLKMIAVEQFLVWDAAKVAGTCDRIVTIDGKRYIADLKTGSIEYGALKISMQLSVYARSTTYDVKTHERKITGVDTARGLVIHLPAGSGQCEVHWVDLAPGNAAVATAQAIHRHRKVKAKDLYAPYAAAGAADPVLEAIAAAPSPDACRALWAQHEAAWTDAHTAAAKQRLAELSATVAG